MDDRYQEAVTAVRSKLTSPARMVTSFLHRHMKISYNTAARFTERMVNDGVLSDVDHTGRRFILPQTDLTDG